MHSVDHRLERLRAECFGEYIRREASRLLCGGDGGEFIII